MDMQNRWQEVTQAAGTKQCQYGDATIAKDQGDDVMDDGWMN